MAIHFPIRVQACVEASQTAGEGLNLGNEQMTELLQSKEAFRNLVQRLSTTPVIVRSQEEPETLAHAFSDLEISLRKFLHEQLPKLADPSIQGEPLGDLLLDIREEFRHILYHLHDPQFFRVLEPTHEWLMVRSEQE
ncbi:hypothetical protein HZZ13_29435 [Bradyrhizobium sp. CNPSo 4010]|uniref:Hemerythrin HHE cation binding domain-containing protein n=1 Tax=Bradyrhizobium agreste TaxID=2751811 RepID=A0ABS0PYB7_9BRAD|nr:hypothetical protein [Bradyrhizobium agreste]MBH5401882.1 hypothetical protein [Bradyrhizobium agreste]